MSSGVAKANSNSSTANGATRHKDFKDQSAGSAAAEPAAVHPNFSPVEIPREPASYCWSKGSLLDVARSAVGVTASGPVCQTVRVPDTTAWGAAARVIAL